MFVPPPLAIQLGTNSTIEVTMALGGQKRGVWSKILDKLAGGKGRQEGCQKGVFKRGASFDHHLLTNLLTTPSAYERLESNNPRPVGELHIMNNPRMTCHGLACMLRKTVCEEADP